MQHLKYDEFWHIAFVKCTNNRNRARIGLHWVAHAAVVCAYIAAAAIVAFVVAGVAALRMVTIAFRTRVHIYNTQNAVWILNWYVVIMHMILQAPNKQKRTNERTNERKYKTDCGVQF